MRFQIQVQIQYETQIFQYQNLQNQFTERILVLVIYIFFLIFNLVTLFYVGTVE